MGEIASLNLPWRTVPGIKPSAIAIADAENRIIGEFESAAQARYIAERCNAGADAAPVAKGQFVGERADMKAKTPVPVPGEQPRIALPQVTLCMIETREHALAALAVWECIARIEFGDVLIFTDKRAFFHGIPGARFVEVPDWPEKIGWSRCCWQELAPHLRTSHVLCIQWDSWVIDQGMWSNDWLAFDYIGAPWWYKDGMNVGNGGFSLRSAALMRHLRKHRDRYPCTSALDDDLLCRGYRPRLMDEGFVWAPQETAFDFAFECVRPDPARRHFGFHACFNFGLVLEPEPLAGRAAIMARSKYITKTGHMWNNFVQANPEFKQLTAAAAAS